MANTLPSPTKLLFTLSGDFGELSSALSFIEGQPFQATLAMPPRLHSAQRGSLDPLSRPYSTLSDLLETLDAVRPDVLLLFSGYLFGVGKILDEAALGTLVADSRRRGCPLITSDPFLGLMANPSPSLFSDAHPAKGQLLRHFASVAQSMRGVAHLYPAQVPGAEGRPSYGFFNRQMILPPSERRRFQGQLAARLPVRADRDRWMFVLSSEDFAMQVGMRGREAFEKLLIRRMQETVRCGKQPVLVAPGACIERIRGMGSQLEGAILLPFCPYDLFHQLCLEAEYVFYWNLFSNSVLGRVANALPVIFFDHGHFSLALPPLHRLAAQTYYGDTPITVLTPSQDLDPDALAEVAARQKRPLAEAIDRFRMLPDPSQVIRAIGSTPL